jgi:uncharacterized protein (DUF433 family)
MRRLIQTHHWTEADPREAPAYGVAEAAHYLRIPKATLRAWVAGQGTFRAVIAVPEHEGPPLLSFVNLVEVHVLDALRRQHLLPLPRLRRGMKLLSKLFPATAHPLAKIDVHTDGFDLFVEHLGDLVNVTRDGQVEMRRLLEAHLRRVDRDEDGIAVRLYPFTRKRPLGPGAELLRDEPRSIVIDPRISFGRPVLVGTGVPTGVIAERYKAGESIDELAADYRRERLHIEEAIRCELEAA